MRFRPKGKLVVLGLVTSRSSELESQELRLERIDEAARYVALEDLAVSPQYRFASTLQSIPLSWDERAATWSWWSKPRAQSGAEIADPPRL